MRIAFCSTGFLRTAEHTFDGFLRFFGDLYPYIDIFIHTWNINKNKIFFHKSSKILEIYKKNNIDHDDFRNHSHLLQPPPAPDPFDVLKVLHQQYKNKIVSVSVESLPICFSPQYNVQEYTWNKVIKKVIEHETLYKFKYDVVIKSRLDLIFPKENTLKLEIDNFLLDPNGFYSQGWNIDKKITGDTFHMAKSDLMDKAYTYAVNWSIQTNKNEIVRNIGEYLTSQNVNVYRTRIHDIAVYRPETIPVSSLNYEKCYNIDQDWYWSANNKFRYPE